MVGSSFLSVDAICGPSPLLLQVWVFRGRSQTHTHTGRDLDLDENRDGGRRARPIGMKEVTYVQPLDFLSMDAHDRSFHVLSPC